MHDIANSYNHTQHRGLGGKHTPTEIHRLTDPDEIQNQFKTMYKTPSSKHKPITSTLSIGEYIRLTQIKPTFKKGEAIKGIFYREELVPTSPPETYQIDIIKSKMVAGKKKYLV